MREPSMVLVAASAAVLAAALASLLPQLFLLSDASSSLPPSGEGALMLLCLFAAAVHDVRTRIVPNAYAVSCLALHATLLLASLPVLSDAAVGVALRSLAGFAFLGGGSLAFSLAFQRLTGRSGMGGADIKLLAAIGFAVGPARGLEVLLGACLAFFAQVTLGAVLRLAGLARPRAAASALDALRETHPFVPALAVGALLVLLL